jgi:uncharacterized membrane protein
MVILEHKIEIKVPDDKIWRILINLEEVAEYNTYIKSVKSISEEKRVGASRECQFKSKPEHRMLSAFVQINKRLFWLHYILNMVKNPKSVLKS